MSLHYWSSLDKLGICVVDILACHFRLLHSTAIASVEGILPLSTTTFEEPRCKWKSQHFVISYFIPLRRVVGVFMT